ncbi:hypothetical protein [Rhodopirellula bahusiensis]|uniref:hypothetical protein n=1 Tax=Rhodopirellula bahusiensis TaxID=2014065 RepID=UPI003264931D
MEEDTGQATLLQYLKDFPQFAVDLLDLSREITLGSDSAFDPTSAHDEALIASAWKRHAAATPGGVVDPLGSLQPSQLNQLSVVLDLPRQVFLALRERRVIVSSISHGFLEALAKQVDCSFERLVNSLNEPPRTAAGVSNKSEVKPAEAQKVTFEQILTDAEIEPDRVATLTDGE